MLNNKYSLVCNTPSAAKPISGAQLFRQLGAKGKFVGAMSVVMLTSACGGGGGGGGGGAPLPGTTPYSQGAFPSSSQYANKCAAPRSNTAEILGTVIDEKYWIRSWINETYLWYDEVTDRNPAGSETVLEYFASMRTQATTVSGRSKDRYHYSMPTEDWEALSQSGQSPGFGLTYLLVGNQLMISFVEPGSPAAEANLSRGDRIAAVGNVTVSLNNRSRWEPALFPDDEGELQAFTIVDRETGTNRSIVMTSEIVTADPVQLVDVVPGTNRDVGYMLFNSHNAVSEAELADGIQFLTTANGGQPVLDLVLDIRYNGGGYLDIASELAYMIAGNAATQDETFEEIQFNDKHPSTNPITGRPLEPTPFHSVSQGFSLTANQPLPTLNLTRVYVLTGSQTCSASEALINALRGVDVEVIQIGATTCGKPYGFYPQANCGTTYFAVQFQGVNAKGFGGYADGFSPANASNAFGVEVPGCAVVDDLGHQLGDVAEARLAAAINYRSTGQCPTPSASFNPNAASLVRLNTEEIILRSPAMDGKAMRIE